MLSDQFIIIELRKRHVRFLFDRLNVRLSIGPKILSALASLREEAEDSLLCVDLLVTETECLDIVTAIMQSRDDPMQAYLADATTIAILRLRDIRAANTLLRDCSLGMARLVPPHELTGLVRVALATARPAATGKMLPPDGLMPAVGLAKPARPRP
jgi:hypothetical protein